MGLWSALGAIGGAIAAPFTGGASLIPTLAGIGSSVGGAIDSLSQNGGNQAASAAQGRIAQAQAEGQHDRNALDFYNTARNNALQTPAILARQAAAGDTLNNLRDVQISGLPSYIHVPTITGGTRPSNLGDNARNAGAALSRNAILQMGKGNFDLPSMPMQTPLPTAGGWENTMGWLGRVGGLAAPTLSAINGIQNQPPAGPNPNITWFPRDPGAGANG